MASSAFWPPSGAVGTRLADFWNEGRRASGLLEERLGRSVRGLAREFVGNRNLHVRFL